MRLAVGADTSSRVDPESGHEVDRSSTGAGSLATAMRVWIDQDLCTGDGLCVDHCHDVFTLLEDGIAYVVEDNQVLNDPGSSGSLAQVKPRHVSDVIKAAEVCPGECIFIEIDAPVDAELDVRIDGRIAARVEIRDDLDDEAAA